MASKSTSWSLRPHGARPAPRGSAKKRKAVKSESRLQSEAEGWRWAMDSLVAREEQRPH